jgi:hypothetical protein
LAQSDFERAISSRIESTADSEIAQNLIPERFRGDEIGAGAPPFEPRLIVSQGSSSISAQVGRLAGE